jgi:tripartite-type tricarboxylate transporter receptor subunit TctC
MKKRFLGLSLIFCGSIVLASISPEVRAQSDGFYRGKTIRIMVGSTAGGFYDRWARLFARYMPKYIPGQPGDRGAKHDRGRIRDRRQSRLQCGEA